jgi:hypothetical protein
MTQGLPFRKDFNLASRWIHVARLIEYQLRRSGFDAHYGKEEEEEEDVLLRRSL